MHLSQCDPFSEGYIMLGSIFGFISEIFKPAADLIDELHTSDEEKNKFKESIAKMENAFAMRMMEYEGQLLEARSNIIMTETKSDSWLAKNWRPLTMLSFVGIVASYWFGYQPENMTQDTIDQIFSLIKLGLGGYVVGRSVEKAVTVYKK